MKSEFVIGLQIHLMTQKSPLLPNQVFHNFTRSTSLPYENNDRMTNVQISRFESDSYSLLESKMAPNNKQTLWSTLTPMHGAFCLKPIKPHKRTIRDTTQINHHEKILKTINDVNTTRRRKNYQFGPLQQLFASHIKPY